MPGCKPTGIILPVLNICFCFFFFLWFLVRMDQENRVISQLKIIVTLYINRFLYLWVKTPVHSSVITVKINKRLYSNQLKTCCVVDTVSEDSPCSYLVCLARCWVGWEGRVSKSSVFAQSTASGKLSDLGGSCGFFS